MSNCLSNINKKHELVMTWWRYDKEGVPHKIGYRLFNGRLFIKYNFKYK